MPDQKKQFLFLLTVFFSFSLSGQWSAMTLSEDLLLAEGEYRVMPEKYKSFNFDSKNNDLADGQISLPTVDGTLKRFSLRASTMMQPGLSAKFPEIKTYIGTASDGSSAYIDQTKTGLHAVILQGDTRTYIDPIRYGNNDYIVYDSKAYDPTESSELIQSFSCDSKDVADGFQPEGQELKNNVELRSTGEPVTLRNYVLAIATTGEYCGFHGGEISDAMAAIVTAINRVNSIMNVDMA